MYCECRKPRTLRVTEPLCQDVGIGYRLSAVSLHDCSAHWQTHLQDPNGVNHRDWNNRLSHEQKDLCRPTLRAHESAHHNFVANSDRHGVYRDVSDLSTAKKIIPEHPYRIAIGPAR